MLGNTDGYYNQIRSQIFQTNISKVRNGKAIHRSEIATVCYRVTSRASTRERVTAMAVREKELKTAGVVVGDEIHNSINNLQDSVRRACQRRKLQPRYKRARLAAPSHRGEGVIC